MLEQRLNRSFISRSALLRDTAPMTLSSMFRMSRLWSRLWTCVAVLGFGASLAGPAGADGVSDHERARAALQAGEILSLQKVLERVQASHPGDVLEVELEREQGRWVYELKLLQRNGALLRLDVDARTAEVLRSRQRPPRAATPPDMPPETPASRKTP
jgi:hypothetical protein